MTDKGPPPVDSTSSHQIEPPPPVAHPDTQRPQVQAPPPPYPQTQQSAYPTQQYASAPPGGYSQPGQVGYSQPGQAGYSQQGQAGYSQPGQAGYSQQGQGGYAYYGQQPGVTVVSRQTFQDAPVTIKCQSCQSEIVTNVDHKIGLGNWAACGGVILFGLVILPLALLGCCFIPFCIKSLKDTEHKCPNCNALVGVHKRFS